MSTVFIVEDKTPDHEQISVADINRLRWHCRRGMLELDMVLARFLDEHIGHLTPAQQREFEQLVGLEDQDLWQCINTTSATDSVVELLLRDCMAC